MKSKIQLESRSGVVDHRDSTGSAMLGFESGLVDKVDRDGPVEDAQHPAHCLGGAVNRYCRGKGRLMTRCRNGLSGITSSASRAAISAIRSVPTKNHIRESLPPLFHKQKARYRRPIFLKKGSITLDPASSGNSNNCWRTQAAHRFSR